ncbi:MAG: hypothetical protein HYT73_02525 [Candidatus Aenigmarchaeota archaeon]|nr:hypothetical protein [Candidatus Aenigmarchaeota archaeon]
MSTMTLPHPTALHPGASSVVSLDVKPWTKPDSVRLIPGGKVKTALGGGDRRSLLDELILGQIADTIPSPEVSQFN